MSPEESEEGCESFCVKRKSVSLYESAKFCACDTREQELGRKNERDEGSQGGGKQKEGRGGRREKGREQMKGIECLTLTKQIAIQLSNTTTARTVGSLVLHMYDCNGLSNWQEP